MPWEIPIVKAKAWEQVCRKYEKIPDPLPKLNYDPPMSFFNNEKTYPTFVPYDLYHNCDDGYDPKSNRDDRRVLKPIFENIFKEEERKFVPVTCQLDYGRPALYEKVLDTTVRSVRVNETKDFYRSNGVNLEPELETKPKH